MRGVLQNRAHDVSTCATSTICDTVSANKFGV
jgi:hypothetical protein